MNILAIDIGNTTIQSAIVSKRSVKPLTPVNTNLSAAVLKTKLTSVARQAKRQGGNIKEVIICSVVPKASQIVKRIMHQTLGIQVNIVGIDMRVPIKNNYRPQKAVGQDRLVGAFAAQAIYGTPAIVIDLGTAITFDVINKKGIYEGGIIVPGIRLSAESLFNKTALLPSINTIEAPRSLIGQSTKESILSGVFHGYGAMCSGLIDQLRAKKYKKAKVIVTGGHTKLMQKYISAKINVIDEHLVFKGLYLLSKRS